MNLTKYFSPISKALKFPLVRQYDQIDCAPAALLSILKYYGGDSTLVHVRQLCQTTTQGSSMFATVQAAKQLGFDAFGATGEYHDLMNEKMPCIAHVIQDDRLNHFVVITKIDRNKVHISDPGKGAYILSKPEFSDIWKQKAVILLSPQKGLFKAKSPSWIQWVWQYMKKEQAWIQQTLFLGFVTTGIGLMTSVFVRLLIDQIIPEKNLIKIVSVQ